MVELSIGTYLEESRTIGDECLLRILKTSTKLTALDVRGYVRLDAFVGLPAPDLERLVLGGCSVLRG